MKRNRRPRPPVQGPSAFAGFRFPPDVILLAVRWYLRYGLSYRDLEELLAERGIEVDHVTLYRWVQRFTPLLIDAARPCRHAVGARWFTGETYVKVAGVWRYVYRAVDQHGQVIDILVSKHRDIPSARRFFTMSLRAHRIPTEVITDRAPALANVIEDLIPSAFHNTGAVGSLAKDAAERLALLLPKSTARIHVGGRSIDGAGRRRSIPPGMTRAFRPRVPRTRQRAGCQDN